MEKTEIFQVRSYGWQELARLYSPDITGGAAVRRFKSWVDACTPLAGELEKAGWKPGRRVLTPRQVQIVVNYFGEP